MVSCHPEAEATISCDKQSTAKKQFCKGFCLSPNCNNLVMHSAVWLAAAKLFFFSAKLFHLLTYFFTALGLRQDRKESIIIPKSYTAPVWTILQRCFSLPPARQTGKAKFLSATSCSSLLPLPHSLSQLNDGGQVHHHQHHHHYHHPRHLPLSPLHNVHFG